MAFLRLVLRDRMLASALALVLITLLLMQGLTVGFARSAMTGMMLGRGLVICAVSGPGSVSAAADDHRGDNGQQGHPDCPCGVLCRLAAGVLTAILIAVALLVLVTPRAQPSRPDAPRAPPPRPRRGLTGYPRAPPLFS